MVCCSMRACSLGRRRSLSGLFPRMMPHLSWCMRWQSRCGQQLTVLQEPCQEAQGGYASTAPAQV